MHFGTLLTSFFRDFGSKSELGKNFQKTVNNERSPRNSIIRNDVNATNRKLENGGRRRCARRMMKALRRCPQLGVQLLVPKVPALYPNILLIIGAIPVCTRAASLHTKAIPLCAAISFCNKAIPLYAVDRLSGPPIQRGWVLYAEAGVLWGCCVQGNLREFHEYKKIVILWDSDGVH